MATEEERTKRAAARALGRIAENLAEGREWWAADIEPVLKDGTTKERRAWNGPQRWWNTEKGRDRIDAAIARAEEPFWLSIAGDFPEITTGDLAPDTVHAFKIAMRKAVIAWITGNEGGE